MLIDIKYAIIEENKSEKSLVQNPVLHPKVGTATVKQICFQEGKPVEMLLHIPIYKKVFKDDYGRYNTEGIGKKTVFVVDIAGYVYYTHTHNPLVLDDQHKRTILLHGKLKVVD